MARDPNLITLCNGLPARMDRPCWRLDEFVLLQKMHLGYASAVYKAHCKCVRGEDRVLDGGQGGEKAGGRQSAWRGGRQGKAGVRQSAW